MHLSLPPALTLNQSLKLQLIYYFHNLFSLILSYAFSRSITKRLHTYTRLSHHFLKHRVHGKDLIHITWSFHRYTLFLRHYSIYSFIHPSTTNLSFNFPPTPSNLIPLQCKYYNHPLKHFLTSLMQSVFPTVLWQISFLSILRLTCATLLLCSKFPNNQSTSKAWTYSSSCIIFSPQLLSSLYAFQWLICPRL